MYVCECMCTCEKVKKKKKKMRAIIYNLQKKACMKHPNECIDFNEIKTDNVKSLLQHEVNTVHI